MRSAPLPNGRMLTPALPMGAFEASVFISLYEMPSGATLRLIHELRIPVPLMHSSTPSLVCPAVWLTCANVLTRDCGS